MSVSANKDFFVKGDGVQHNTLELIALRDHIRAGPDRVWHVEFDHGHYAWQDERWLSFGNRSVVLDFNNSLVECQARPLLPLGLGPIAWDPEYPLSQTIANSTVMPGHRLETVAVGAQQAVLIEEDSGLLPCDAVLVAGYLQQLTADGAKGFGWPPNFRFFEWKTVAAVDGPIITFRDPFRFSYDAAWPDIPTDFFGAPRPFGAPRLWRCRLDNGRHVNRSLTIRNANFIGGRSRPNGTRTSLGLNGLNTRLENCTTSPDNSCFPTVAKRVDFVDCRLSRMEMDKIVEAVSIDRCEVYGGLTSNGGSVLDVRIKDTGVYGLVQGTARRSWVMDNVYSYNGVMLSRGLTNTPFALTSAAKEV